MSSASSARVELIEPHLINDAYRSMPGKRFHIQGSPTVADFQLAIDTSQGVLVVPYVGIALAAAKTVHQRRGGSMDFFIAGASDTHVGNEPPRARRRVFPVGMACSPGRSSVVVFRSFIGRPDSHSQAGGEEER